MIAASSEAEIGISRGEYPFGAAVCSSDGEQITVACDTVISTNNPSAHAEVDAIKSTCNALVGASQASAKKAGHEDLGIIGRELAERFFVKPNIRESILGNQCVSLLLMRFISGEYRLTVRISRWQMSSGARG